MDHRRLPGLDRTVSALGAGCWTIGGPATNRGVPIGWADTDDQEALAALHTAHDLGITLFDTADVYGMGHSERLLGQLLRTIDRDTATISSKVGYFAGTAEHPYQATQLTHQFETTLRNLGTGYLDLYFLHSTDFGPHDRYLDDALNAIQSLKARGLIKAVGMRAPHDFAEQWADTDHPQSTPTARFLNLFHQIQPEVLTVRHNLLSPLYKPHETDIFSFARRRGIGILIKQALGQGILTGRYSPQSTLSFPAGDHRVADPTFRSPALARAHRILGRLGERFGDSPRDRIRVALQYANTADPRAVVLVGFRDRFQVAANVTALTDPLSADDLAGIRAILAGVDGTIGPAPTTTLRSST
jgi:aryl-alcohol dehydrogenase-like predicted oxidoreductase